MHRTAAAQEVNLIGFEGDIARACNDLTTEDDLTCTLDGEFAAVGHDAALEVHDARAARIDGQIALDRHILIERHRAGVGVDGQPPEQRFRAVAIAHQ